MIAKRSRGKQPVFSLFLCAAIPDLAQTASPIGSARFAKSSKRELDKSSSLLPCGAKPSALACYKNTL